MVGWHYSRVFGSSGVGAVFEISLLRLPVAADATLPFSISFHGYGVSSLGQRIRWNLEGGWGWRETLLCVNPRRAGRGGWICPPPFSPIASKHGTPAMSNLQYLIVHQFDMFPRNLSDICRFFLTHALGMTWGLHAMEGGTACFSFWTLKSIPGCTSDFDLTW